MRKTRRGLLGAIGAGVFLGAVPLVLAGEPVRVVYHIDDSQRAIPAIRNMENHLRAAPSARIVVVALGGGIDFLLRGAKDSRGNPYEPMVDDLMMAGVQFRLCQNTLAARQIDASSVLDEVRIVPSGVAEIARLQFEEGYAYLKP